MISERLSRLPRDALPGPPYLGWGLEVLADAPAVMEMPERLLLHGLVRALRPAACLEIGTCRGGGALLISAALDACRSPCPLVLVDPAPRIEAETWKRLRHRTTLIQGASPAALSEAAAAAGAPFDFVFIDGGHETASVAADIAGVLPFLADGARLLLHDSTMATVAAAIDAATAGLAAKLHDCAELAPADGDLNWGLRLLIWRGHV